MGVPWLERRCAALPVLLALVPDARSLASAAGGEEESDQLVLWLSIALVGAFLLALALLGVPLYRWRRKRLAEARQAGAGAADATKKAAGLDRSGTMSVTDTSMDEDNCVVVENIHKDASGAAADSQSSSRYSVPDPETLSVWIKGVYKRYNPTKVARVDALLEKYKGREEELIEHIVTKYRLGPCAPRHHKGCAQNLDEVLTSMCGMGPIDERSRV